LKAPKQTIPIVVTIILILGTTSLAVNVYRISQIHWPYNIGQELTFRLEIFGYRYSGSDTRTPYSDLNNTVFYVNITSLPIPHAILLRNGFLQTMEHIKTITYLENRTRDSEELNQLVSRAIIPSGAYDLIDRYFIDISLDRSMHDCYISSISDTLLIYGHSYTFVDEGDGWNCVINMTSGYPVFVEIWEWEICPATDEDYRIILSLIT